MGLSFNSFKEGVQKAAASPIGQVLNQATGGIATGGILPGMIAQTQAEQALDVRQPEQSSMGFNPYQPDVGREFSVNPDDLQRINLTPQSFAAQRGQALSDIDVQSASGLASAQTQLAQSGGLSAADRMALASQFNRDKIAGRQGALGKYGAMEAQAASAADKANQMYNTEMLNRNLYETAGAGERSLGRQSQESMLDRQMVASGRIADEQAKLAKQGPGGLVGGKIIPGIL